MSDPGLVAHIEQVRAYYLDPTQAPHQDPPRPPTAAIAQRSMNAHRELLELFVHYAITGDMAHDQQPCEEAKKLAAQIVERATGKK